MKKIFTLFAAALMAAATWADSNNYYPTSEYNVRPKVDGTGFDSSTPKAASETNASFEINQNSRFFALQQYTVANIASAESLSLTLLGASSWGTDALALWIVTTDWSASSTASEFNTLYSTATGVTPGTAGTTTTTYLLKDKSNIKTGDTDRTCTFNITGDALSLVKSNASFAGTFTILITNNVSTVESNGNSKRQYYSSGNATESLRPYITVTTPATAISTVKANATANQPASRAIVKDGKIVIVKDGKQCNVAGQQM